MRGTPEPTTIFTNTPRKLFQEFSALGELHQQPSLVNQNDRIRLNTIGPPSLPHFRPQQLRNDKEPKKFPQRKEKSQKTFQSASAQHALAGHLDRPAPSVACTPLTLHACIAQRERSGHDDHERAVEDQGQGCELSDAHPQWEAFFCEDQGGEECHRRDVHYAQREKKHSGIEAWTTAESLKQWICPEGSSVSLIELDVRVGGTFRIEMQHADEGEMVLTGIYREIRPPEKLVFTWVSKHTHYRDSLVTLDFFARGEATELILLQTQLPDEEAVERHTAGWTHLLEHLTASLQKSDRRPQQ